MVFHFSDIYSSPKNPALWTSPWKDFLIILLRPYTRRKMAKYAVGWIIFSFSLPAHITREKIAKVESSSKIFFTPLLLTEISPGKYAVGGKFFSCSLPLLHTRGKIAKVEFSSKFLYTRQILLELLWGKLQPAPLSRIPSTFMAQKSEILHSFRKIMPSAQYISWKTAFFNPARIFFQRAAQEGSLGFRSGAAFSFVSLQKSINNF